MVIKNGSIGILNVALGRGCTKVIQLSPALLSLLFPNQNVERVQIFGSLHLWSPWKDTQKHINCYCVVYTSLLLKKGHPCKWSSLGQLPRHHRENLLLT